MASSDLRIPAHFSPDREVHVVISTKSGNHGAQDYFDNKLDPYIKQHIPHLERKKNYFIHATTSPKSVTQLTTDLFLFNAKKGVKSTILLLSGDGGMIDILNTFTTTLQREIDDSRPPSIFFKPIIVLFPCGTANALCHSAGIVKGDPLKVMMEGRPRPLPQFEVKFSRAARLVANEGKQRLEFDAPGFHEENPSGQYGYYDPDGNVRIYGCVVFSWGLHSSLVALSDTEEMRKHGSERFKMAAGTLLKEDHIYHGTVKVRAERGGVLQLLQQKTGNARQHKYILASMVSNLEETFCISPETKVMDGNLRLVAIGNEPAENVMAAMTLAYQEGKHVSDEKTKDFITYQQVDSLRIEFEEEDEQWRQICVDGKIVAVEKGGWAEVRIVPASGLDGRRVVELVS